LKNFTVPFANVASPLTLDATLSPSLKPNAKADFVRLYCRLMAASHCWQLTSPLKWSRVHRL
jgi:hypothetical protein